MHVLDWFTDSGVTGRVGILYLGKARPRCIPSMQVLNLILSRPPFICGPPETDSYALFVARPRGSYCSVICSSPVCRAALPRAKNILLPKPFQKLSSSNISPNHRSLAHILGPCRARLSSPVPTSLQLWVAGPGHFYHCVCRNRRSPWPCFQAHPLGRNGQPPERYARHICLCGSQLPGQVTRR